MAARTVTRLVAALLVASSPLHAQLVTNGGFETPVVPVGSFVLATPGSSVIPGWSVVGAVGHVAPISTAFVSRGFTFPSQSGAQWLDMTGLSNSATGVEQAVTTVPGTAYDLSFWVGNIVDPTGFYGSSSTVNVFVNGIALTPATNAGGAGTTTQSWQQFVRSFTATGTSTTIRFLNGDPVTDNENGLDAVVLTPAAVSAVPEPGTVWLVTVGLAGLSLRLRRRRTR